MLRPRRSVPGHPRAVRSLAAVLAACLALGALQLVGSADAGSTVLRQVSSRADAGVLDRDGDGRADVAPYGADRGSLPVGRLPGGRGEVRVVLPFAVTKAAVDAMDRGGKANVAVRVWRVDHLGSRRLAIESVGNRNTVSASAYGGQATRVARLAPVEGRVAVDVSAAVRAMSAPGTLTLRLRLDDAAARRGAPPQVAVALSEARNPTNRPVLTVTTTGATTTTKPTPPPTAPSTPTTPTVPPTSPPSTPPTAPPAGGEIFRDDFSGTSLDLSKWRPNWLAGSDDAITKPVNSAELSCYDPANVSVGGGYLRLRAEARSCRANNGITYPYASGLVESAHDFTFTYGRMEARIWLPPAGNGKGANWPAFWANGTGKWPTTGELDVMEVLEGRACYHFHSPSGGPGGCASLPDHSGWHTFAAEWRAGVVTYFYDGQQVGRITSGITGSPMYLILNLALSTKISPPVTVPSEMLVDWVRVTR